MQQTKSYWRVAATAGVLGAFVVSACVVTTSTDGGAGAGGTATSSGGSTVTSTGGTTSTAAGTGGTGGTGGTVASAGSSGSTSIAGTTSTAGGSGGSTGISTVPFQCDPSDGSAVGTPASSTTASVEGFVHGGNVCSTCIATSCPMEFGACYATNPGNQCGYGGPKGDGTGEFPCVKACISAATGDGGVLDDATLETCANQCVTPSDSANMGCEAAIGSQTSDLVGCVNTNCASQCLGG